MPTESETKQPRLYSCSLCSQRKIRCDRKQPCSNCIKAGAECVTAVTAPRRRRTRFVEKDLLDRLRRYETILGQHGIEFEPFVQGDPKIGDTAPRSHDGCNLDDTERIVAQPDSSKSNAQQPDTAAPNVNSGSEGNVWQAINQEIFSPDMQTDLSDDEITERTIQQAWNEAFEESDNALFDTPPPTPNLLASHPPPASIFRLWQIYLDNVNPLLKVTHSPTLQQQLVEASCDLAAVQVPFEALMFGIYSAAIMSMSDRECSSALGERRDVLSIRYLHACRQALNKASFLRTSDMRVLTALLLYLMSLRESTPPQSLFSLSGIAVRIARRLGLDSEARNRKFSPFEAEMRRRLWWQIVLFDSRVEEWASHKASILTPVWDCSMPSNLNDGDLLAHLERLPADHEGHTDSTFVVVRCQIVDFVRHSRFHLDYVSPRLSHLARDYSSAQVASVDELEVVIQEQHLKHYDPQIPLHSFSLAMNRAYAAKWGFCEVLFKLMSNKTNHQFHHLREKLTAHAIRMLEFDTEAQTNPLLRPFVWFSNFYIPFPAYIWLLQELRRSSLGPLMIHQVWATISRNFEGRELLAQIMQSSIARPFSKLVVKAWEATESALSAAGQTAQPPALLSMLRSLTVQDHGLKVYQPSSSLALHHAPSKDQTYNSHEEPKMQNQSGIWANAPTSVIIESTGVLTDLDQSGFEGIDWDLMGNMMDDSTYDFAFADDSIGLDSSSYVNQ